MKRPNGKVVKRTEARKTQFGKVCPSHQISFAWVLTTSDEFDVSIFLTATSTTHTILTKQKVFADKARLKSTSGKMGIGNFFGNKTDNPIDVDDNQPPAVLLEEDAEETRLADIPEAPRSGSKRGRDDDDAINVSSDEEAFEPAKKPASKRKKVSDVQPPEADSDDKKKMALNTNYEGFSIYGRVLCLIVKRKGAKKPSGAGAASGSEMLENWVSTQANNENIGNMDDDG